MADEFSEDEIRKELENLGYRDVPPERLVRLKADLDMFVAIERSKHSSDSMTADESTLQSSEYTNGNSSDTRNTPNAYSDVHDRYATFCNGMSSLNLTGNVATESVTMTNLTVSSSTDTDLSNIYRSGLTTARNDGEDNLPVEIESSRKASAPCRDVRRSNDVRTFYVSVAERDLLTGYHSTDTNNDLDTTCSTNGEGKKMMKRKVLRKIDGEKHIDESITESETDDDVYGLMQRLTRLPLNERINYLPKYAIPKRPYSAAEPSYRLPENYDGPKSLIRPVTANPHTKNIKKTDPVNRHQMYQQSWNKHKRPEEKSHKGLRWNVREQMIYLSEVPKKSQRSYVPNSYVVPSDKKRKALRWQIRQDMAEGVMPSSQWY